MNSKKVYKDFYDLFGLPTNATDEEINNRTKSMIKKFHPDLADEEIAASAKQFKVLNIAKETLEDSEKREEYDKLGHHKYINKQENYDITDEFTFKGRRSITDNRKKPIDTEDVDDLIANNLDEIHNSKHNTMKANMTKTTNTNKSEKEDEDNNITGIMGILIFIGSILKSEKFKYAIMFLIFGILYYYSYVALGLIAMIFVILFSLSILLAVYNLL